METVIVRDVYGTALRRIVAEVVWPAGVYVYAPEAADAVASGDLSPVLFPAYDVFFDSCFTPHDERSWQEMTRYRPGIVRP